MSGGFGSEAPDDLRAGAPSNPVPGASDREPAHPWSLDRDPLGPEGVRDALLLSFPDLSVRRLRFLASGWENDVWVVNEEWIFRFPRRREVAETIDREVTAARAMAEALAELDVRVPVAERLGGPGDAFPYRFAGYRAISGAPADRRLFDDPGILRLAGTLGAILTRIHAVERVGPVASLPSTEEDICSEVLAEVVEAARALRRQGFGDAGIERCLRWVESGPPLPPAYDGEPCFLHNDLCPDHVLVDPETGRVTGLLDFTDAEWGDPALDFVMLPAWLGWDGTRTALDAYEHPLDPGFDERLRFLARGLAVEWLYDAVLRDGDVEKHRRWVRRAFGEGERPGGPG